MNEKKPGKKRTAATQKSAGGPPTARKRRSTRALVDALPDNRFWVNFGPVLRNLRELRDALAEGMSDEQFAHHVGPNRNDFAKWVEDVLGDATCAKALSRARTRQSALRVVDKHLQAYA